MTQHGDDGRATKRSAPAPEAPARHSFSELWAAAQLAAEETGDAEGTARSDDDEDDDAETEEDTQGPPPEPKKKRQAAAAGSATGDTPPPKRPRRRRLRKPTYLIQKEEREVLLDEIRILEARAELLRIKTGLPTEQDKRSLAHLQADNFDMEEKIHGNLMHLGRCQGMISRQINATPVNPMKTFIHLPRNLRTRRELLRDMKEVRLRRAEQLVHERLYFFDSLKPYTSEERFQDDRGVYNCKRFDVIQFDGLTSARRVFEALMFYHSNVEISVTETLGHLTIREDADEFDPTIWHHRVVSRNTAGFAEDLNVVGFMRFDDSHLQDEDPSSRATPVAVIACDSVDKDDLHPYVPSERVRKDITASYTISELRRPDTQEIVVVLKRVVFASVHPPQFAVSRVVKDAMEDQITAWANVVLRLIRDKVYADVPSTESIPNPH